MNRSNLASLTYIPGRTIRFYKDKGIISAPNSAANGYRDYDTSMVPLLKFIKNAQQLGFSLAEIKELSNMKVAPDSSLSSIFIIDFVIYSWFLIDLPSQLQQLQLHSLYSQLWYQLFRLPVRWYWLSKHQE